MSATLDPIVVHKLTQFARRRRRLLLARGLSAGLVTLLLGLALVGFVDWFWLLGDQVRWLLSGAVYVSVIGVVWMTSIRQLSQPPERRDLAVRVEELQPELRERLLSAVELATDDLGQIHDSPVFRQLLQGQVAQQMMPLQIRRLLPLKLIAFWLVAAVLTTTLAVALLSSPDNRFRQLATRALLPGANIARISRIQVEILQPNPPSLLLAEDESVAVVVRVSGGQVSHATLETVTANQGTVRQKMTPLADDQFAANIHVASESVEYRVLAGDAITQWFSLEAHPRPRVVSFEKRFHYPDYAGLDDESLTETHGDLIVLEGTSTELVIDVDQEITQAELRIESIKTNELTTVPLTAIGGSGTASLRWSAPVPVDQAAIYRVHLVSELTGLDNPYSPKYEIRPQPDLIPRTGFVDQLATTLLLPPNDLLELRAMAEDDLPLASLQQHVSVNGRDWEVTELVFAATDDGAGRQVSAAWPWDLEPLALRTGDQVLTKLVAVDRKGNQGESIPLRIVVAAADFDPQRHLTMERKFELYDAFSDFADQIEQHKVSATEILDPLGTGEAEEPAWNNARIALLDLVHKHREQSAGLLERIKRLQPDMPAGADSQDVELTGRVVARLQREHASAMALLVDQLQRADTPQQQQEAVKNLRAMFERVADDANNLASGYQSLASYNFIRALAVDLDALLRQQELIAQSPTQTWDRLVRQETVVLQQLDALESLLTSQRGRLPENLSNNLLSLVTWSDSLRLRLQDAMESEDKLSQLQGLTQDLLNEFRQKQQIDTIDGGLPQRLVAVRKDLEHRSGSLYLVLDEVGRAAQQHQHWISQATHSNDSLQSRQALDQAEAHEAEIRLKSREGLRRFSDHRELTQNRRDADSQFAADAGLTSRAATFLLNQYLTADSDPPAQIPDQLLKIAPAYRTLEAGHQLSLAHQAVLQLLEMERWEHESLDAHLDHPRHWDLLQQLFETASIALQQAGVPNEIVGALNQVRWSQSVRDANRKISERRWNRNLMVGSAHEIMEIRTELEKVVQDVEPLMAEARAVIAEFAPTIPEMARQAAEQLRQLEEETTEAADEIEQPDPPAAEPILEKLQQQQDEVNAQIEDLFEALIEDANNQDVLDDEQRERARDADASIATIQPPATEMNRAMQRAQNSDTEPEQVQQLAQAAEQQERTAQALELVADHFERLDEGLDVSDSRDQLRPDSPNDALADEMERQFDAAQQLSQQFNQDAESLLAELEAELQRNPAMQEALSEIAQNTLEDAQDALELSARDEQQIQQNNERADEVFRQRKSELAAQIREMGTEATQLSNALVARAQQSAAAGKTADAVESLQQAREELRAVASTAQTAHQEQLLSELKSKAQETQELLRTATETLRQAEGQTNQGKEEEIHPEDAARQAARQRAEQRHREFIEQQKQAANNQVQQAENSQKQSASQVTQAEQRVAQAEQQVTQAKANLEQKPDDTGRKQALAQQQANLSTQKQLLQQKQQQQAQAEQKTAQTKSQLEQLERQPLPELNAANPDTQLADRYAEDAIKTAEELTRRAEQVAESSDFQESLTPPRNQVASGVEQQQDVAQDVQQIADDVARAARHERRLNKPEVAEAIEQSEQQIRRVADAEVADAGEALAQTLQQADEQGGVETPPGPAAQAQRALAESQQALAQQAQNLGEATAALSAEADSASVETSPQGSEQTGGPSPPANPSAASGADAPSTSGAAAPGDTGAPPSAGTPGESSAAAGTASPPSPVQQASAQQLAQALDELDRLQAAAANSSPDGNETSVPGAASLDRLAQMAQQQRAAMASSRAARQQQARQAMSSSQGESEGIPPATGPQTDFDLRSVNRREDQDWGKLRQKTADDLTRGRPDDVAQEYRRSVEAYFKVLAERASQGSQQ